MILEKEKEIEISHQEKVYKIQIRKRENDVSQFQGQNLEHFFKIHNLLMEIDKPKNNNKNQKRKSLEIPVSPILGGNIFQETPKNVKKRNSFSEQTSLVEITTGEKRGRKNSFFGEEIVPSNRRKSISEGFTYNPSEISDQMNQALLEGIFTLKVEGEISKVKDGKYYIKKEINRISEDDSFLDVNQAWIPAEPKPEKSLTWTFWRPADDNDKWFEWAWKRSKKNIKDGYYIIIGKGVRGNTYNLEENACFSPCGTFEFIIPKELRNFEGIKKVLDSIDIEGLVLTFKNEVSKITKVGYGLKWSHGPNVLIPDQITFTLDLNEVDDKFQHTGRKWVHEPDPENLRFLQYNILAPTVLKPNNYPYVDSRLLHFEYRKESILMEVTYYKPNIMTFQEMNYYDTFWKKELEKFGYDSIFYTSKQSNMKHGCAIFWKKDLELIDSKSIDFNDLGVEDPELKKNNIALLAVLKRKNQKFIVATSHLYWNWKTPYIRFRQLNYLYEIIKSLNIDNIIFAGDFNTLPSDPLYGLLTNTCSEVLKKDKIIETLSSLDLEDDPNLEKRKMIVKEYLQKDNIVFQSSYKSMGTEAEYTTVSPDFEGTLDYIMYHGSFSCKNVLTLPKKQNIPNEVYSSDHFSILSELKFD